MNKLWKLVMMFVLVPSALAQVDPNRVVATINGEEIKGAEYYRRMEFLPGVGKQLENGFVASSPGFLTIEELVTEKLVMQLAKQKGVYPTDLEVDAELKNRETDTPNYVEQWTKVGGTIEDLRAVVRYDLAEYNLEAYGITMTDQEVENFYNQNPTMYTVPKKLRLRVIVVADEAAKATVDQELASGKAFADVAKENSIDVTKAVGGDQGAVPASALKGAVKTAISATKIGATTEWIPTQLNGTSSAFLKFQLVDVIPEKKIPLDDTLRRKIRRQVTLDRGRVKNNIRKEMQAVYASAKINIAQPEFAKAYRSFLDAYLKQAGGG